MKQFKTLLVKLAACTAALTLSVSAAAAQEVKITQDMPFFEFDNGERFIVIERIQDNNAVIDPAYAKVARPCPPFCVQPMEAAPGVKTLGELEVIEFIENEVSAGTGLLIDARLREWYDAGTIPGSVNMPFRLFDSSPQNPFVVPVMQALGSVQKSDGSWDHTNAKKLTLYCNGQWCEQSARAIRHLISLNYPVEKINYYRGGMQSWLLLGLTVEIPGADGE